ncbi:unnamed protein product [Ectocarpus sp. CCAP 1310/34]|nr:unnamed protein product [Ectocarpus sp. CCAP 1310/34]
MLAGWTTPPPSPQWPGPGKLPAPAPGPEWLPKLVPGPESPTALAPGAGSPPAFPPGPGLLPTLARGPGSSVRLLPTPPTLPPNPIREEQANYADWLLPACQSEMKRHAEAAGHKGAFRYGDGVDEINTSISSVKKPEAVKLLLAQDAWRVSKGLDPDWKQAPQGTPQAKRVAKEAKAKLAAEEEERRRRCRSSGDAARLCFIMFSDEMYEKVTTSEQAPTDRNKRDNHAIGVNDPDGVWDEIVDHFVDENLRLGGVRAGNPKSHDGSTAPGVPKMWEALQSLDYDDPAKKWREEWTFKEGSRKGELDKARAREKVKGWWTDMRAELGDAKKKKEKSGNNAEHYWSFCNQKLYVLLVMDWYELRGGDSANEHCARYFSVRLSEEDEEAFNTLSMEDEQSSSDSDEPPAPKGKPRARKAREKRKVKPEETLVQLVDAFKTTSNNIAAAMNKIADNDAENPVGMLIAASDRLDDCDEMLKNAKEEGASKRKN